MAKPAEELRLKAQQKWPGATVAERKRNSIKHQHPTDPARFMLDTSIGPIHYGPSEDQEIDTAWQVSAGAWDYEAVENDFRCYVRNSVPVSYRYEDVETGHFVELTWTAVEWVNDEGGSESAASFSQVTPAIDDDTLTWSDIAPGWDVRVHAQTARLAKWLDIESLASLGAPTIGGTNEALQISLTLTMSSGLELWADGEKWSGKNNTQIETSSDLEFRDTISQQAVFWFQRPIAFDDNPRNDDQPMTQRVKRIGQSYRAELSLSWSWLQSAEYPIHIDPTVDYQVGASNGDSNQTSAGTCNTTSAGTAIDHRDEWHAYYWSGVTLPNTCTIDAATVDVVCDHPNYDEPDLEIRFEDNATPGALTTGANNISGRTYTTAVTYLDNANLGASGGEFISTLITLPELKTIIQELVDSYDYSSGAVMVCAMRGAVGIVATRDFANGTYDGDSAQGAKLHIEYTTGGGTPADLDASQSDSITVGESVALDGVPNPSQSDSITLGESVTAKVGDPQVDASDSATVGESVTVALQEPTPFSIDVSDSITLGESVTLVMDDLEISQSDSATVGESVTTDLRAAWYNPDSITVNAGSIVSGTIEDTWSDDGARLQLAETTGIPGYDYDFYFYDVPATATTININGYYEGNPGHNVKIQQWNFTTEAWTDLTGDTQDFSSDTSDQDYEFTIFGGVNYNNNGEVRLKIVHNSAGSVLHNLYIDHMFMGEVPVVTASEPVTVGDSAIVVMPDDLTLSQSESVAVGEATNVNISAVGQIDVSVQDSVIVGDSATADLEIRVLSAETLSIGESHAEDLEITVAATEGVSTGESVNATVTEIGAVSISVSDAINVGESVSADVSDPRVSVEDGVTVGESANVDLVAAGTIQLSVTDGVVVGDEVSVTPLLLAATVSDGVAISDTPSVSVIEAGAIAISVSDGVNVGDSVSAAINALFVSANESITIAEAEQVGPPLPYLINVTENITLQDIAVVAMLSAPLARTYAIDGENRTYCIDAENRTFPVPAK